jgi:hypothetical protein
MYIVMNRLAYMGFPDPEITPISQCFQLTLRACSAYAQSAETCVVCSHLNGVVE